MDMPQFRRTYAHAVLHDDGRVHVSSPLCCAALMVLLGCPQVWQQIMTDVSQDEWVSANIIFDILNEPDSYGLTWDGTQLGGQGVGYWYHQVMAYGHSLNPSALPPRSCQRFGGSHNQHSYRLLSGDQASCQYVMLVWSCAQVMCLTRRRVAHVQSSCSCLRAWHKARSVPTGATAMPLMPTSWAWCALNSGASS